jgi:polygalacturonase
LGENGQAFSAQEFAMVEETGRRSFLALATGAAAGSLLLPKLMRGEGAMTGSAGTAHALKLNVRDAEFGAKGDGVAKDTAALQAALDRCDVLGGGEVVVPAGSYLIGSVQLRSGTTLRLEEGAVLMGSGEMSDYAVTQVRWEGRWIAGHIGLVNAIDAKNVSVLGPGKIAGNPAVGGRPNKDQPLRHPALVEFVRCDGVHLSGFSTSYARMWNVHPTDCTNVRIEGLTIRSNTGNGDGIDVDSCRHVRISKCDIATGDDCISLKSGRGLEGYTLRQTTEDVVIEDCTFADNNFACIGIGSETSGGIRGVRVRNCRFTSAKTFAIYIKSRPGRGAFIEDIVAEDLDVSGMMGGFLRFNLLASGLLGEDPVPGLAGIPQGRNFVFRNVKVDDVPVLVDGAGVPVEKPLRGLVLENITGTCGKGITLANARGVVIQRVRVTGFAGPLLATANVTGVGLAGAAKADLLKAPEPVPERASAYELH